MDEVDNDTHMVQMQAFLKKFWKEQGAAPRPPRRSPPPPFVFPSPPRRLAGIDMEKLEITNEQSFKTHNDLPLARIKRIMKSDEDVRMISVRSRSTRVARPRPAGARPVSPPPSDAGGGPGPLRQGLRALHPRTHAPILVLLGAVEARSPRPRNARNEGSARRVRDGPP